MKLEYAQRLCDVENSLKLHEEYSGRGMYGKKTAALSGHLSDLIAAIAYVAVEEYNPMGHDGVIEFAEAMRDIRQDSYGLQQIFY